MSAKEILQQAEGKKFVDSKGRERALTLSPPLSAEQIGGLEGVIGRKLPEELRELVCFCGGFEGTEEGVLEGVFFGVGGSESEVFPNSLSIAYDACGNFWLIDFSGGGGSDMSIFYACHDPPVYVFQSASLGHFTSEVIRMWGAPGEGAIEKVHEHHAHEIWSKNPHVLSRQEALAAGGDMRKFAESLDDSFEFTDLRNATIGQGFSWGRYGAETVCKRFGKEYIFAIKKRELNWFQKIFGV